MHLGAVIADRFHIEGQVAVGGMGTVFRAHDRVDGVTVALKILRGQDAFDVERFKREATILADLLHPGIVRYVAHGVTGADEHYLAMEWLEGEDLASRLTRGVLSPGESVTVLRKAAEALAFAHTRAVVHRDIKPSNLFLPGKDVRRLKLVDFGIARPDHATHQLTYAGGILGTPGYMAPEMIEGMAAHDPQADVFSLGCVVFECLAGRPAFEGAHIMAALAKLLFQQPARLRDVCADAPAAFDDLIARMLSKDPKERPADGSALCAEVERIGAVLDAWTAPSDAPPSTLASAYGAPSSRVPSSLTLSEQRLVSLVLAGDPDADADEPTPLSQAVMPPSTDELRAAVAPFGAHLVELLRGSLVAMISGPGSAMDRAERAALCALALRERFPEVPLCVVTGRGVSSSKVIEGEVIDRGVRALRATRPGTVRLDDVTAGMLSAHFKVMDGKGLFLAGETSIDESIPVLLGKPSPWVGRSRELSVLEGIFAGCVQESLASGVLVVGPAGAGKSRLRLEFLAKVRRSSGPMEILSGRANSLTGGSPFGIVADIIRRAAGIRDGEPLDVRRRKLKRRLGRHLEGATLSRVAAFLGELTSTPFAEGEAPGLRAARDNAMLMSDATRAAWEDWLAAECAAQPVVLAIEDLHWGDAATVRLIDATLRNLHDLPLMLLAFARPEVHKQFPNLWTDREVQTVKLGPLPPKASEKLVQHALGDGFSAEVVAHLVARADGNPFYLEELIRAVSNSKGDVLPDSVLGMVEARLDAEGSEAKRVLRAASLFGDRFSKFGVAALLGGESRLKETEAWLQALASRELVTPVAAPSFLGPSDYVFRHAIVREAAYAMLTEADRALGHKLAGEWLERTGHTEAMAMAEHFRRGAEPARAVRWYRRAAEQALEANDLAAALERAASGIACGAEGEELGALRLVEAEANVWRGELASGAQRGNEAAELLPRGSPGWFRAVTQAVIAADRLGDLDRVLRAIDLASATARGDNARRAQLVCLSYCVTSLVFGGRYAEADALIQRLDAAAQEPSALDPRVTAMLEQMRAYRASTAGDPAACLHRLQAALTAFEQAGDHRNACAVRSNLGFISAELGDFEGAEETLRSALAAAERMGLDDLATMALHNLGHILAYRGRLDEARIIEQRAVDAFHRQGEPRTEGVARSYLAEIALLSGDLEEAEHQARAAADALSVAPALRAAAVALLARILLARGRAEEALAAAREAHAELEALGTLEEGESMVRLAYAEALAAAGAGAEADAALAAARRHLLARAAKISDPKWRERFLTCVPDNARTLALAHAGGERAPAPDA